MDLEFIKRVDIAAVYKSAEVLWSYIGRISEVCKKSAVELVTKADTKSEKSIIETIQKVFPGHAILAEERCSDRQRSRCDYNRLFKQAVYVKQKGYPDNKWHNSWWDAFIIGTKGYDMKKELINKTSLDDHSGCFGNFNIEDLVCKKLCALRLRCAIDSNKNTCLDLLEDLIYSKEMFIKIQ